MRRLVLVVSVLAVVAAAAAIFAHEVDPATLERARRDSFPAARSWTTFRRRIGDDLAKSVRATTGVEITDEDRALEYHVAFRTERPGRRRDVLGVLLLREVETANGWTTIGIAITRVGRIGRIVGVDGPDARRIRDAAQPLRDRTVCDAVPGDEPTVAPVARAARAALFVTRDLLGPGGPLRCGGELVVPVPVPEPDAGTADAGPMTEDAGVATGDAAPVASDAGTTSNDAGADASAGRTKRAHMHHSKHGGIVLMQGEYHMEVVYRPDGEVRLYLSNAYREPIAPSRARGRVIVTVPGRPPATVRVAPAGAYLSARGPAPGTGENMVEVDVTLDGRPWRIEVPFRR